MSPQSISVLASTEEAAGVVVNMTSHPYYPAGVAIPGYVANSLSTPVLLVSFFTGIAAILTTTYLLVTRIRPSISRPDIIAALWFGMCACIHLFFEGMSETGPPDPYTKEIRMKGCSRKAHNRQAILRTTSTKCLVEPISSVSSGESTPSPTPVTLPKMPS